MPTLNQLSQVETQRGRQLLAWMLRWSPLFRFLEERAAFVESATSFDRYPDDGTGSLQSRGLGQGYTGSNEAPSPRQEGKLGFVGDSVLIDRSHVVDHQRGLRPIGTWFTPRFRNKAKGFVRRADKELLQSTGNKTGSERRIQGLLTILNGSNVAPWGTPMVIDAAAFVDTAVDHLDLTVEAHREAFMRGMEQILPNFEEPGLLMNRQLGSMLGTMARERKRFSTGYDTFGNRVEEVDATPIIRLNDGSITNDEPDNASTPANVTTSLLIASAGEGMFNVRTNAGLEVTDEMDAVLDDVRSGKVEWELRAENVIDDRYALWRVRNIKVPGGSEDFMADLF